MNGYLMITYRHHCPDSCPDNGKVVVDRYVIVDGAAYVVVPQCATTGAQLEELARETTPPKPERCKGTLGDKPSWMSEGQFSPCRCELSAGHDGECQCEHTRPAAASPVPPSKD